MPPWDDYSEIEWWVRSAAFLLTLLVLGWLQSRRPLRGDARRIGRVMRNLALLVVDTLTLRIVFPVLAVGLAAIRHQQSAGLLPMLAMPDWLDWMAALLLLDLAIYWQHRCMHAIPLLWRMHRVHHSDTGFDLSTGVRFHPLEITLSMLFKLGLVWLLGPPPGAVLLFEILLSSSALWTHSDTALAGRLEHRVRRLIVTPSMHRIHHSIRPMETNSNYGFLLSVWDRVFGSYRAAPAEPERTMPIGLEQFRAAGEQRIASLLLNPFISRR